MNAKSCYISVPANEIFKQLLIRIQDAANRDVNVFIFLEKTIVSLWKRRQKIENETILFKNDHFFKKLVFKNGRFSNDRFYKIHRFVNNDHALRIVNDKPSLTIV